MAATLVPMRELRNHTSQLLARAEAGEELVITVNGRPVATLAALSPKAAMMAWLHETWGQGPVESGLMDIVNDIRARDREEDL